MAKLKDSPVDELVKTVLLEEKGGSNVATTEWYTLRWSLANELGLVVVALYQRSLQLHYVEALVDSIKRDVVSRFGASLRDPSTTAPVSYDAQFDRLLKEAESGRTSSPMVVAKRATPTVKAGKASSKTASTPLNALSNNDVDSVDDDVDGAANGNELGDGELAEARARLSARVGGKRRGGKTGSSSGGSFRQAESNLSPGPSGSGGGKKEKREKKGTVWHDGASKKQLGQKAKQALDKSKRVEGGAVDDSALLAEMRSTYLPEDGEEAEWNEADSDLEECDLLNLDGADGKKQEAQGKEQEVEGNTSSSWAGAFLKTSWGGFLHGLTGTKVLEERDLEPVMTRMREQLMSRNVAAEVANDITASVQVTLTDQKLKSFTRVNTAVQSALKDAVSRVLTPKKSTDVLREVKATKSRGKVYSMAFVGINGVGKSTSLAKVAYYLKENGIKVLIAACDTFRSGAVEQLRVHGRCLEIPIFEKGYAKDSSSVARDALKHAEEEGYDCVLIDTAGRMQNNEPLMRALSKLINENEPNLVLFVGEALVGNDGVNQLAMFNQALANNSPAGRFHQIDGVVLTKFDTIDTKVGAALSMCYKTGQPILFVGTGQKYTHLRKLNVNYVIKALFT